MTSAWSPAAFASAVLTWFEQAGRKDLPWQLKPTPYRVWVSEVMLQQTQVAVVIPYFERFTARFPDLHALAAAQQDDILQHWAGLGYYARARHLHCAARMVVDQHGGELPLELQRLMALPGIGRSTAGAILSLAGGQAHAILDGNVKRVLARCFAIAGWPGQVAVQKSLWALADDLLAASQGLGLPSKRFNYPSTAGAYNQGMMDLGATLCTRARPACDRCPLHLHCLALSTDSVEQYPEPKPRRTPPRQASRWLVVQNPEGKILLEQRPACGLWGGLWTLPEISLDESSASWCARHFGQPAQRIKKLAERRHCFSHFQLDIHPEYLVLDRLADKIQDDHSRIWTTLDQAVTIAVPAPLKRLLLELLASSP